jgi:hypothetical protein
MKNVLYFAAGVAVGVAASYRYVTKVHAQIAADEINEAREHYRQLYQEKVKRDADLEQAAENILRDSTAEMVGTLTDYSGGGFDKDTPKPESTKVNLYIDGGAVHEIKAPYVISADEFLNGEVGYDQFSLTYFVGDETLCDQMDEPVESVGKSVGVENLSKFGELSEDDNIVYVRNDKYKMDFEIARSMGKYSVEVRGEGE